MEIREFQRRIETLYLEKDRNRGIERTFLWFVEEVGELARDLLKRDDKAHLEAEFADVFAWLSTLASLADVDLQDAVRKYGDACPKCGAAPCLCAERGGDWGE